MATRKKAADIFYSKVISEDKIRDRLKVSMEKAQLEESKKLKVFQMKEMARR